MSEAQQPFSALPQGHRLQEYELLRVLGVGGFGITYRGFDHHLYKAVATKEYLPPLLPLAPTTAASPRKPATFAAISSGGWSVSWTKCTP